MSELDRLTLEDVLGERGLLQEHLAVYEDRPGQRAMAACVERTLERGGVSLIEAGTGIGKTFAYLAPALLSGQRVVVSTGTRALQDQLVDRDVPTLARLVGQALPVAVLKGLSNYVCRRRVDELLSSPESILRPELVRQLPTLTAFVERSMSGEKRELAEFPEDAPIWGLVESGPELRIGARCRFYDACFVTHARRAAERARVVIVNHHLFFADLALRARGASVLPAYDAVIFDEAHQLGDVMTASFGLSLSPSRIERLVRDADRAIRLTREAGEASERLLRHVLYATSELATALEASEDRAGPPGRRALRHEEREALAPRLFALDAALEAVGGYLRSRLEPSTEPAHDALLGLARRVDELRNDVLVVVEGGHGLVVWLEATTARSSRSSRALGASPVDVSSLFRESVLEPTHAVILTSATLGAFARARSAPRDRPPVQAPDARVELDEASASPPPSADPIEASPFAFLRRELGVDEVAEELLVPSPFDHARQAALYVPPLPDPRDPSFLASARAEIEALVRASGGGAFVLTTSHRVQGDLAQRLAPRLRDAGLTVLVSGERPKHELLERFRADGDAVLIGTMGFWEGIDVPGRALRLVVLDRLPFDAPTDPLVRARCERIEARSGSAFKEYLLPSAALTLRQGFGRLLRSRRDRGLVAVLDVRLRTKGYGKTLLRALPEVPLLERREEALAFLAALATPSPG